VIECYECKKQIEVFFDYVSLALSSVGSHSTEYEFHKIYFHLNCFEYSAGESFYEELRHHKLGYCFFCKNQGSGNNFFIKIMCSTKNQTIAKKAHLRCFNEEASEELKQEFKRTYTWGAE